MQIKLKNKKILILEVVQIEVVIKLYIIAKLI